jgi:hypothetical protein
VTLYSIDKHAIYATVSYANRDVGLEILKMGLAWYVPWSGAKTPLAEVSQTRIVDFTFVSSLIENRVLRNSRTLPPVPPPLLRGKKK